MSNSDTNNDNKSLDNEAIVGVEVVKDDTVVFEDGDFDEYNEKHDYEEADDSEQSGTTSVDEESSQDEHSDKQENTEQEQSDEQDKSSKNKSAEQEDKSGITMAGIHQWASKLKEDFKSDASGMTQEVSEKATAMMLGRLVDAVDVELAAFDKSIEVAKDLVATAEDKRKDIVARKQKYQGMIDKLDQE